mmetsp:Transcript_24339/g.24242  ORF Transcript_24339/g.24242 Transcript_24339/m.24242 type:complete len:84 (+) Transcript_24339:276-527(+)
MITKFETSHIKGSPDVLNNSLLKKIKIFSHQNMEEESTSQRLVDLPSCRNQTFKFTGLSKLTETRLTMTKRPKLEELISLKLK